MENTFDDSFRFFSILSRINESKTLTNHLACKCKYKFDGGKCYSNQKWNNGKCS